MIRYDLPKHFQIDTAWSMDGKTFQNLQPVCSVCQQKNQLHLVKIRITNKILYHQMKYLGFRTCSYKFCKEKFTDYFPYY